MVLDMVDEFHKVKEDAAFEVAFSASKFAVESRVRKTSAPVKPKVPWYLDPGSGGKSPDPLLRKPGVSYAD